jgi:hypothetical protein
MEQEADGTCDVSVRADRRRESSLLSYQRSQLGSRGSHYSIELATRLFNIVHQLLHQLGDLQAAN